MTDTQEVNIGPYEDAIREIKALQKKAIENIGRERLNALSEDELKQALLKSRLEKETQESKRGGGGQGSQTR